MCKCLVPNKFLCRYPLRTGATLYAIIFACVTLICIIMVALQMMAFSNCANCILLLMNTTEKTAYSFSAAFIIICIIMLLIHLMYLWYTQKMKSSIVLVWVVTTAIWLGQTFCLTLVLLFLYTGDISMTNWFLCLIFGLLAYAIAIYGVLVGYGFYRAIKWPIVQS